VLAAGIEVIKSTLKTHWEQRRNSERITNEGTAMAMQKDITTEINRTATRWRNNNMRRPASTSGECKRLIDER
jgi:hypothetical protein